MWKIATTSMSVFQNLDCLSLVVCSNTTLLKLHTMLFLFFSKFCASKSGVRLIYGCGLYTDVYGTYHFQLTIDGPMEYTEEVTHLLTYEWDGVTQIRINTILGFTAQFDLLVNFKKLVKQLFAIFLDPTRKSTKAKTKAMTWLLSNCSKGAVVE